MRSEARLLSFHKQSVQISKTRLVIFAFPLSKIWTVVLLPAAFTHTVQTCTAPTCCCKSGLCYDVSGYHWLFLLLQSRCHGNHTPEAVENTAVDPPCGPQDCWMGCSGTGWQSSERNLWPASSLAICLYCSSNNWFSCTSIIYAIRCRSSRNFTLERHICI